MDKVNYVVQGIAVYVEAMANAHHCSPELVWLRLLTSVIKNWMNLER